MNEEVNISEDVAEQSLDSLHETNNVQEGNSFQNDDNEITLSDSDSDNDNQHLNDNNNNLERMFTGSSQTMKMEKPSLVPNESTFNGVEYLIGSLTSALDSIEFDKTLVMQSKMAGEIHNISNDVLKTIEEMEFTLKEHIKKYNQLKTEIIPEIESNINKSTKIANKLTKYMKQKYPVEYSKGRSKVLDNLTEDEADLYS